MTGKLSAPWESYDIERSKSLARAWLKECGFTPEELRRRCGCERCMFMLKYGTQLKDEHMIDKALIAKYHDPQKQRRYGMTW